MYNKAQLVPLKPTKPREVATMGITGPLPSTKAGYKYILVICDHFTKWVELFRLKTMDADEVALQIQAKSGQRKVVNGKSGQRKILKFI